MFHKKVQIPSLIRIGKVLLLIDWDNVFFCLFNAFREDMRLENKFEKMMAWIKRDIGELFGDYGFIFAPEYLSSFHQGMCIQNRLKLMICPKKMANPPRSKPTDTVDENIIWFGNLMMRHPDVGIICLVSGDNHFVPLFEAAGKLGIKRALVPPTIDSLARTKELIRLVDKHPTTSKKMVLRLDLL